MKVKNKKGVIDDILLLQDDLGFLGNVPIDPNLVVTPLWEEELVVLHLDRIPSAEDRPCCLLN